MVPYFRILSLLISSSISFSLQEAFASFLSHLRSPRSPRSVHIASSSDPSKKRGREEDDDESRHRKLIKEGKEEAKEEEKKEAKEEQADDELFVDDNRWSVEMLAGTFKKLRGVAAAFKIKPPHEDFKDRTIKGLVFRIHGLAEQLEKHPMVQAADDDIDDGDDGSDSGGYDGGGSDGGGSDGGAPVATTAPLAA